MNKKKISLFLIGIFSLCNINPFSNYIVKAQENDITNIKAVEKKNLAPTPPMGWNSWNTFMHNPNEKVIKETADAMVEKGLLDAGYEYLVLDDGYIESKRDEDGNLVPHKTKFPNGFNGISDYIHGLGLKFGMYNSAGTGTCMGLPGSFGREEKDAKQFVDWGIDYFKYDFCNNPLVGTNVSYAPDIDKITISNDSFNKEIEAESGELVGKANVSNGLVGWIGNNEGELILTVEAPEEAEYTLSIKYVGADDDRKAQIDINGVRSEIYTFLRTNGWGVSDAKEKEILVNLKSGVNKIRIYNEGNNEEYNRQMAYKSYKAMSDELLKYDRDVVFSICEWGSNSPWLWANDLGNLWRTTYDITSTAGKASWSEIMKIYDENVVLAEYAGPNGWNDPDMLVVGLEGINYEENKAHFSLWAMMAAPLMLGNDIRNISDEVLNIITNKEVIALNQDILGKQAVRIHDDGELEVLAKPLENGDVGLLLFNRSEENKPINTNINKIVEGIEIVNEEDFNNANSYNLRELWDNTEETITNEISSENIPSHGVKVYRVSPNINNEIKGNLKKEIDLAIDKLNSAVEGIENGQYHIGSKDILEKEKSNALNVYNEETTDEIIIAATKKLKSKIEIFEKCLITPDTGDINGNGKINIGDLSIVSRYYNKFNSEDELNVKSDINFDGKVDSYELNFISNRVLN